MKRRRARELILKILYRKDFVDQLEGVEKVPDPYAREAICGIEAHQAEIDRIIGERAQGWRLERLHSVDRNLLRLAIYELLYRDDVPAEVVIDEAVELAKKYGTEKSPAFINGILDRVLKERATP
jgi:N utilization substance protein B